MTTTTVVLLTCIISTGFSFYFSPATGPQHHGHVARRALIPLLDASLPPSSQGGLQALWSRLSGGPGEQNEQLRTALAEVNNPAEDMEYVPLVLVVGATGRTGRIIVRKLVIRGFRVAVLVRSLSSETLNRLGSGVSYSYGDMTEYRTLLDAMEDVDKVVFCAGEEGDHTKELLGLRCVLRAFQDTRTFMYGEAEATKLSLFKFRKDTDFNQWQVESSDDEVSRRLSDAGIGPKPTVVYWKRSSQAALRNGIFVGRVFDNYLGSATISCGLRGKTQTSRRLPSDTQPLGAPDPELSQASELSALDLGEYSGLIIKSIGDGKIYTLTVRTTAFEEEGIEYQANFVSSANSFSTARLPFSSFVPYKEGRRVSPAEAAELDRRSIVGMAISYFPTRNDPTKVSGEFYLSLAHMKAYRKRDEPDFVYVSDAGVGRHWRRQMTEAVLPAANVTAAQPTSQPAEEGERDSDLLRVQAKLEGEQLVRGSGLTYFIVRPSTLEDLPGGSARIRISQDLADGEEVNTISRTDLAEVIVSALLDPRASNIACTLTSSEVKQIGQPKQDISKMLELIQPNKM